MKHLRAAAATIALALAQPAASAAQSGFPAWIGLYDSELVSWLENENQLDRLCDLAVTTPTVETCMRDKLSPMVRVWPLRARPDASSETIGQLIIIAMPGRGLFGSWNPADAVTSDPLSFIPDVFDQDWGYGPLFHQSFSDREGDWFLLPRRPLAMPGWLRAEQEVETRLLWVTEGDILFIEDESWLVMAVSESGFEARPEQAADMWCNIDDPPPLTPFTSRVFTRQDLIDEDGHYIMRPKYTRGC